MIRRLLWMTLGAGLGVSGYRRITRICRGFARPARSGASPRRLSRLRGVAGFARDVRDGMDLYAEQQRLNIERRRATAGPTLELQQASAASAASAAASGYQGYRASRNGSRAHH
jgi:hypothetical protein